LQGAMLYATLICTDEACCEEFEAWGEPDDFDALLCEGCGCVLQPLGFCEVSVTTVTELPGRTPHVQLRDAA
jgi:hypothetical protein